MKLEQTFEVAEWEETGDLGFKPMPSGESWDPLAYAPGLAHDFMEHAGQFSLRGEIKAHASMYLIRYETGYCPRLPYFKPIEVESFGMEWIALYRGLEAGATLSECEPQEKLEESVEIDLAVIVSKGKKAILAEIEREYLDVDAYVMLCKHFAEWFRKGYHEAEERFSVIGVYCACDAFDQVLQYFLGQLSGDLITGSKVKISLDLETGELEFQETQECWTCGHNHDGEYGETCKTCYDYDNPEEEEEEEELTYAEFGV